MRPILFYKVDGNSFCNKIVVKKIRVKFLSIPLLVLGRVAFCFRSYYSIFFKRFCLSIFDFVILFLILWPQLDDFQSMFLYRK